MTYIDLGSKKIGKDYPAYIVAEIGINHNGDMELAKKTILAAKTAGADAVKFQNYKTEDFVPLKNITYEYLSQGKLVKEFQYDMFKRYELNHKHVMELKDFCDQNKIDFHSTPTNFEGVDLLKKIGVNVLKNGSDFLTNLELIDYMGKSQIPTVLSTGMATISEIDDAVTTFRGTGNENLILLHCTSSYPTPAEDIHLMKIKTLRDTFGVISGFSDHSEGPWAAIGSITYKTAWIEKHFTLDKNLPGPDHRFSCDPKEFSILVEGVRYVEKATGIPYLGPTESEKDSRRDFRLSCCAKRDLKIGDVLSKSDIIFARPGCGFLPKNEVLLLGRTINKPLKQGDPIQIEDLT
ncbi:MAG: N-acetylneuraminate synthase family protein [Proteobacteria bacterium]|nr:N-acetylneuraminate synthase family protein [Pseudomonadota bacterium]